MKRVAFFFNARRTACLAFALLLSFAPVAQILAQSETTTLNAASPDIQQPAEPFLRLETLPIAGGAELLTIFGTLDGLPHDGDASYRVPLVSVLRDTLNDSDRENDRLRYVWMLTHTRPTFMQRVAASVPFLYARVSNKKRAIKGTPPPIIDLGATDRQVWACRRYQLRGLYRKHSVQFRCAGTLRPHAASTRRLEVARTC
jgi:hypothetical protein